MMQMNRILKMQVWILVLIAVFCMAVNVYSKIEQNRQNVAIYEELKALRQDVVALQKDVGELKTDVKPESMYERSIKWILGEK